MSMVPVLTFVWYSFLTGLAIILTALLNRLVQWIVSPLRKLPGPKGRHLPLGNLPEILREPLFNPARRWWNDAGEDAPLLHYTVVFWKQCLVILDKELIKTILTSSYGKESPRFTRRVQILKDTVGNGLVTVQSQEWVRHRRILQPAFNTRFLKDTMAVAVPPRVKRFIQAWKPGVDQGWEMDINSHMSILTLDIVGDVAFSHDFKALDRLDEWSKLHQSMKPDENSLKMADVGDKMLSYFTKLTGFNVITLVCVMLNMDKLNWYINGRLRQDRKFLDAEVDKIVAMARKDNTKARSLLHLMLHARDPEIEGEMGRLSDSDLRDEVKTFMIAGHETTSTWLHWAMYAMVKYPDVQERLYQEVMKYASTDDSDETFSLDQVEQMEYLGAFLQEVLRMFPPVGVFIRYNAFPEKWHGVTVPPDTRLFVSPHLLQRHPKYWDQPDTFLPERWINVSAEEAERRRFAFIPFSAGGRNCKFFPVHFSLQSWLLETISVLES